MKFFSKYNKLLLEVDLYRLGFLLLLISNVILTFMLIYIKGSQKVIITPPVVTKEFEVTGNTLGQAYFDQVGFFLSRSIFSVTPENINISYDMVLPFFTKEPKHLKAVKDHLILQAEQITVDNISQTFYPMKVVVNHRHGVFTVEGKLAQLTGNTFIGSERKSIDFNFIVTEFGTLRITSFKIK